MTILAQVRQGTPFEVALDRELGGMTEPDRRLAHELAAGVLRRRTMLDAELAPLISRGWNSVAPELQDVLRLGAYQLTALSRVPAHAAVDTSVALAKAAGGDRAGGFVNAVLRRLKRSAAQPATGELRDSSTLAREYSHPAWLVRRWLTQFGVEGTEALLRWNNRRPRLAIQPARGEVDELRHRLQSAGVVAEAAPYGAGLVVGASRPAELPGYAEGKFVVQNPAQALLTRFADLLPDDSVVYDVCAAPGGKTVALGRAGRMVVAADISPARARRLRANLERAGSGQEHVIVADGRRSPLHPVDVVLLDVPCLGTGTFARHPDARWRVSRRALQSLVRLQSQLLEQTAPLVRPGGLLLYSTCSLEPEENRLQVERFLENHPEFWREATHALPPDLLTAEGDLFALPQVHGIDGAYAARLRRSR